MQEKILILDFGSQYTQLIARRVRELNVYCEIHPFNKFTLDESVRGVILSGSPYSVRDEKAPQIDLSAIKGHLPLLGVCYGAQYLSQNFGGEVAPSATREYGRAMLSKVDKENPLIRDLSARILEAKGQTRLKVNVYDRNAQVSLSLFSKSHKVSLTAELTDYLDENQIHYSIA